MRRFVSILGIWVVLSTVACSVEDPLPPPESQSADSEADGSSSRVGSLLAEFKTGTQGRSVRINAHFLDARGLSADRALEALEVWDAEDALDRDTCSLKHRNRRPVDDESANIRLELLDVGPITVEGPRRDLTLQARRLPDLSSAFSGVIYGTDRSRPSEGALEYRPSAGYVFRAPGGGSADGFRVRVEVPPAIDLLAPAADASPIATDRELVVRWRSRAEDSRDVYFDVASGFGPDRVRLKCRLENDGRFVLPADLLAQVADGADSLDLALRHIENRPVRIDGLDVSEFTLSTVERRTLRLR